MATPETYQADEQDQSEVFDETNLTEDGAELANFDEIDDVFDVTSALGDGRDLQAMDEAEFDEAAIDDEDLEADEDVDMSLDSSLDDQDDEDDDEIRDDTAYEASREAVETSHAADEAEVEFVGDLETASNADDEAADEQESEGELSDGQVRDLGYQPTRRETEERRGPALGEKSPEGSGKTPNDVEENRNPKQEDLLDEAIEETFPASDPVSVKRIT